MQNTTPDYKRILENENHWFESRILIGNEYVNSKNISSLKINSKIFDGTPQVGKAVSADIELALINANVVIPQMGEIKVETKVCDANEDSEWLKQGTFFVDTREKTNNGDGIALLTIHGYDAMMKAEQDYGSSDLQWPATSRDVVNEIAGKLGVSVDDRTWDILTTNYNVELPASYSIREVLCYIAAMYLGAFIITEEGKLRLVGIFDLPAETGYLVTGTGNAITFGGTRILV